MVVELSEAQRAVAPAYLALLGVVALQRIGELAWSRRNLSRAGPNAHPPADTPRAWNGLVLSHAALVVLPAIEFLFLPRIELTGFDGDELRIAFPIGLALFLLAQVLRYWTIASLGRAWNVRAVVDPSGPMIATGPYRWIRHPNYLAVLIEFTAVPLAGCAWRSWIVLQLVHTPLLVARIRAEERALSTLPGYRETMIHKGRFLPRLRSRGTRGDA